MRMGQGWFARPSGSAFDKINELNDGKQVWAEQQQKQSHQEPQKLASVYRSTKLDVRIQVDLELEKAATEAASAVKQADTKWKAWNEHRQNSQEGRAGKAFQEGMTTFANFLENFSGVVEVVRAADEQYGGLAYGTLSIFVGVFVRKTKKEEGLVEGFDELSYAFPRLETLRSLGASKDSRTADESRALEQLEKLLTETFALVIIFAREATQYYTSRSQRWKETLVPDRLKSGTIVQIRDHLKKVREQCDILMLAQIASLHTKLDDMSIVLHQTASWMRQSNVAASQLHESNLRKLLGIDPKSTNTGSEALDSVGSLLQNSFSRRQSIGAHPESTSLDLLKGDAEFSGWWEAQNSRLFLAGGTNWRPGSSTGTLNWLSEGALLMIKDLQDQRKRVAYYLVQSTPLIGKSHRRSLKDVITNLIFQIAVMREDGFRSELDSLETLVDSLVWNGSNTGGFLEAARSLLLRIFSTFTTQCQVWIVIDRLDQCSWSDDDDKDEADVRTALETLLSVISGVACCVKILITVDAPFADRFDKRGPALSRREREYLMLKPQWRQEHAENRLSLG
jgi:hypothetical protein